jgi:hypothetical protein
MGRRTGKRIASHTYNLLYVNIKIDITVAVCYAASGLELLPGVKNGRKGELR